MTGHAFDMRQANCSVSARGVLRGLHFAQVPPSQAKVRDVREGFGVRRRRRHPHRLPTYGRWDSVLLDDVDRRSIYLSEGLAHGFVALQDDSTVMYLCSTPYAPKREHGVHPLDPEIGIDWPLPAGQLLLSDKDAVAPSLAEARGAGLLPTFAETRSFVEGLRRP